MHQSACIHTNTIATYAMAHHVTCRLWQLLKHTQRERERERDRASKHMCYTIKLWVQLVHSVARQNVSKLTRIMMQRTFSKHTERRPEET